MTVRPGMTDYSLVPVLAMTAAIEGYVERGEQVGGFLRALLSHDMIGTVCGADADNYAHLRQWVQFVHNELPPRSHGNAAYVRAWQSTGGLSNAGLHQ